MKNNVRGLNMGYRIGRILLLSSLISAGLMGCAHGGRKIKAFHHRVLGVTFPRHLGALTLDSITDFEPRAPGAGLAMDYKKGSAPRATVYVYSAMNPMISKDINNPWIQKTFEETVETVKTTSRKKMNRPVEIIDRGSRTYGTAPAFLKAHFAKFIYPDKEEAKESWLYLLSWRGSLVKVRYTYPAVKKSAADQEREAFMQALVGLLTDPKSSPPSLEDFVPVICFDYKSLGDEQIGSSWLVYNAALAAFFLEHQKDFAGAIGHLPSYFEQEYFALGKMLHSWRTSKQEHSPLKDPYLDKLQEIEAQGFLREYIWRYLRQSWWNEPTEKLQMEAFDAWAAENLKDHTPVSHRCLFLDKKK